MTENHGSIEGWCHIVRRIISSCLKRATADFLSIKIKYLMINDKTIAFYIML